MFALGIEYLLGRAIATDPARRDRAEWPPHPDRLYQAMVAVWHETEGSEQEWQALEWIESQEPPSLFASDATVRANVTHYVPVNDSKRANDLLPEDRPRQARVFPCAVPHDPYVYFHWSVEPPEGIAQAIDGLATRVTRLGHSASLVRMWVESDPPAPNRVPSDGYRGVRLRVPAAGRLAQLRRDFEVGRWPSIALACPYGPPETDTDRDVLGSVFDPSLIVLARERGMNVGLEQTLTVTRTARNAIMKRCPDPVPEWISGHDADGRPSREPHLAFVPLANVGHRHSDGHLLGIGLVVPRNVEAYEIERCLAPILGTASIDGLRFYDGHVFEWDVAPELRASPPVALRAQTWTRSARRWATVTPMAFDRHAKRRRSRDPALDDYDAVAWACTAVGLPEPTRVSTAPVSRIRGVPHVRDFSPLRRRSDGGRTYKTHVILEFAEPVRGPVILGAGRFRGYGLCRPLTDRSEAP